jgi:methionyl-tRNA formyltransferase
VRVLFLGPAGSPLVELLERDAEVIATQEPLTTGDVDRLAPDFAVSFGYRHIIKPDVVALLEGRAVNLHIALLPWNRGSDPNLWSWIDGTPKGVTIHLIDEGLDTGDIVAQREVRFSGEETLRSSYDELQREMLALFEEVWPAIRSGSAPRRPQPAGGSYHRSADKAAVEHLLTRGWDTPVADLQPSTRR